MSLRRKTRLVCGAAGRRRRARLQRVTVGNRSQKEGRRENLIWLEVSSPLVWTPAATSVTIIPDPSQTGLAPPVSHNITETDNPSARPTQSLATAAVSAPRRQVKPTLIMTVVPLVCLMVVVIVLLLVVLRQRRSRVNKLNKDNAENKSTFAHFRRDSCCDLPIISGSAKPQRGGD